MATAIGPLYAGECVMHAAGVWIVLKGREADPLVAVRCDDMAVAAKLGRLKNALAIAFKRGRLPACGGRIIGGASAMQFVVFALNGRCHGEIGQRKETDARLCDGFHRSIEARFVKGSNIEPGNLHMAGNLEIAVFREL